jgi:hypothetical protein
MLFSNTRGYGNNFINMEFHMTIKKQIITI